MKLITGLLLAILVAGCATHTAVVPALDGRPRVQVNPHGPQPIPAASQAVFKSVEGE